VCLPVDGDLQERSVAFEADFDRPSGRRSFAQRK
jgi:hypothetical protein